MIRYPLLTLLLLAGCAASPQNPPTWAEIPTPGPAATVRDVVYCGDSWLAVGAIRLGADPSVAPNEQQASSFRPAAWRWRHNDWSEIPLKPVSFYGERAVLRQVACRGGDFAALGGASGGAHGNLRITTWYSEGNGPLVQNALEDFEMFGGGSAIGVEQMIAFADGYLMTGNWLHASGLAGPAVWLTHDGKSWKRLAENPSLASTGTLTRQANGAVSFGERVLLLGEQRSGGKDQPFLAWSGDGVSWEPGTLSGEGSLLAGSNYWLAGWKGAEIATWKIEGENAKPAGGFGYGEGPQPPRVTAVTETLIGACGGTACGLWRRHEQGWEALGLPRPLAATPTSLVLLAGGETRRMLLVLTDGNNLRIFHGEDVT